MDITRKTTYLLTLTFSLILFSVVSLNGHTESLPANTDQTKMEMLKEPISLEFNQIPLDKTIGELAKFVEIDQVKIDKSIQETLVDIHVKDVSTLQLLELMRSHFNLEISLNKQSLIVTPGDGGIKANEERVYGINNEKMGALIRFSIKQEIKNSTTSDHVDIKEATFEVWSEFDKQSFIKVSKDWQMAVKISEQYNLANVEIKLIDASKSPVMKLLAEPRVVMKFEEDTMVEIGDNNQALSIKINAKKPKLVQDNKG